MKKFISNQSLAALALLCSSSGYAATISVNLTENSGTANDGIVNVGDTFSLNVFGSGFPDTVGATLKLTFNAVAVAVRQATLVNGIVLGAGSPFTGGIATPTPAGSFPSGGNFTVLAPTVGTLPTGNFGGNAAFTINFVALAAGLANIVVVDDGADFSWTDASTFGPIPVDYTQANVTVAGQVVPAPAAVWLLGTGMVALAGRRLRRQKAA